MGEMARSSPDPRIYQLIRGDQIFGPYTLLELIEHAKTGAVLVTDGIWREDWPVVRPAVEVQGVAEHARVINIPSAPQQVAPSTPRNDLEAIAAAGGHSPQQNANYASNVTHVHVHYGDNHPKNSGVRATGASLALCGLLLCCVFPMAGIPLLIIGLVLCMVG